MTPAASTTTDQTRSLLLTSALTTRRSVSPKRLMAPGPDAAALASIIEAGMHAPDHGGLHPWRVIEFGAASRAALADLFEQEKRRRDPTASADDLVRAREHATRPPVLLGFVVSPKGKGKDDVVPVREQWLAAGAALGNVLNAAHMLGFGAIMLSGERCVDQVLTAELGIREGEHLAGFISIGSIRSAPPAKAGKRVDEVWSQWPPAYPATPASTGFSDKPIARKAAR